MYTHDVQNSIGFHCTQTNKEFFAAMARKLKGTDLSTVEFRALVQLMTRGPLSQRELNEILVVTSATGSRLYDRMERDGLIKREQFAGDKRVNTLTPTKKAEKLWDKVNHLGIELIDDSLKGVNAKDLETAKNVLAKVRENLKAGK